MNLLKNLLTRVINSGKSRKPLIKVKKVVCPQCMSAQITFIFNKLIEIECNSCGHKFKLKSGKP